MKISIKNKDAGFKKITIFLPLSLIKSKIIWDIVMKNATDTKKENIESIYIFVRQCYKELRKCVQINGHFNLVEVDNSDVNIIIRA